MCISNVAMRVHILLMIVVAPQHLIIWRSSLVIVITESDSLQSSSTLDLKFKW